MLRKREAAAPSIHDLRGVSSHRFRSIRILLFCVVLTAWASAPATRAQAGNDPPGAPNSLQQHYDAAQNFLGAGNLAQAALQYKMFLAEALHELAHGHASARDFQSAGPLFDEALRLTPSDFDIRLDYAEASFLGKDYAKAKSLSQEVLQADSGNAKAHLILGRALIRLDENQSAREQFEAAVAIEPNFENGYALATAHLALKDVEGAAQIFAEMLAGFGDTAQIHMAFGRAYADTSFPDQAIEEFKLAIAKDDKLPAAHYSLGAAYLQSMGEIDDSLAAPEFRKELELSPNDFLSHFELGSIALTERRLPEAESELTQAEKLNPQSPDPPLALGEVYRQLDRPADTETELRKSIALTTDVSRNHYQIQRAYYMLGRLLLTTGRQEDGKKAMETASKFLEVSSRENQGKSSGTPSNAPNPTLTPLVNPEQPENPDREMLGQLSAFKERMAPAIADSYDNLGAIEAGGNDFASALHDFASASQWNPSLEGLDYNWGRAAFSANQYDQAVGPLGRYLQAHPDDTLARSDLGLSLYHLKSYVEALQTLKPIEPLVDADPNLAFAYAVCSLKAGDFSDGMDRLKGLESENANVPAIHEAIGEALVRHGDFAKAAAELRTSVKLNPSGVYAKYNLALALIALQQKDEAQQLLVEVVKKSPQNPDACYQLGKLQLERGDTKAAIDTLESGARINPGNRSLHFELAAAYRKDSRIEDSERETKLYETLQIETQKDRDAPKQN
jgi:tetratricopeptide (TPR) repeat protein